MDTDLGETNQKEKQYVRTISELRTNPKNPVDYVGFYNKHKDRALSMGLITKLIRVPDAKKLSKTLYFKKLLEYRKAIYNFYDVYTTFQFYKSRNQNVIIPRRKDDLNVFYETIRALRLENEAAYVRFVTPINAVTPPLERVPKEELFPDRPILVTPPESPRKEPANESPETFLPEQLRFTPDPSPTKAQVGCNVCAKVAAFKCANCRDAAYCGSECQRSDWKNHKFFC